MQSTKRKVIIFCIIRLLKIEFTGHLLLSSLCLTFRHFQFVSIMPYWIKLRLWFYFCYSVVLIDFIWSILIDFVIPDSFVAVVLVLVPFCVFVECHMIKLLFVIWNWSPVCHFVCQSVGQSALPSVCRLKIFEHSKTLKQVLWTLACLDH